MRWKKADELNYVADSSIRCEVAGERPEAKGEGAEAVNVVAMGFVSLKGCGATRTMGSLSMNEAEM